MFAKGLNHAKTLLRYFIHLYYPNKSCVTLLSIIGKGCVECRSFTFLEPLEKFNLTVIKNYYGYNFFIQLFEIDG